jgi:hypothetical protein
MNVNTRSSGSRGHGFISASSQGLRGSASPRSSRYGGSGDPVTIAGYLGSSDTFDRALIEFAERYADQNQLDHEAFVAEIRSGRLEAAPESS